MNKKKGLVILLIFIVLLGIGIPVGLYLYYQDPDYRVVEDTDEIFINAQTVKELMSNGSITLLDSRHVSDWEGDHILGAYPAGWHEFTASADTGILLPTATLKSKLEVLGVEDGKKVVVYGDWQRGRGEETRLYWMLSYLNHSDVKIIYGGIRSWYNLDYETSGDNDDARSAPKRGNFSASIRTDLRASGEEVKIAVESGNQDKLIILDTRTDGEYESEHIKTSKHYHWQSVFEEDGGNLRSKENLLKDFNGLGIQENNDKIIITYCSAGVRSSFLWVIMRWSGIRDLKNYDGSFWEVQQKYKELIDN